MEMDGVSYYNVCCVDEDREKRRSLASLGMTGCYPSETSPEAVEIRAFRGDRVTMLYSNFKDV